MKKILVLMIVLALCLPTFASCAEPPELESVKAELVALMEASYEVNDILFGAGLKTEYDLSGVRSEYDPNYENLYGDEASYSAVVPEYKVDTDGDGVADLTVKQFTMVDEIKEAAKKVYTESLANQAINRAFTDDALNSLRARYREHIEETGVEGEEPKKTLIKYNFLSEASMDYINTRGGRTVYDYNTMKIVAPSNDETLVVEIAAWYQDTAIDSSSENPSDWVVGLPAGYSWHTIRIIFVKQAGEWRLDTATY